MGEIVINGAEIKCVYGSKSSYLMTASQTKCIVGGQPAATIKDVQTTESVAPFGMCSSMSNPQVATATAAGVLTPQPCTMVPAGTWVNLTSKLLLEGKPCLFSDAALGCSVGAGAISIVSPGQRKVIM